MAASDLVVLRDLRDDDDLDALNLGNPVWLSEETLRGSVAASDHVGIEMFVATLDGVPAGFATANASGLANGYRAGAYLFVRPELRRRGVGGRLWQAVLEVCTPERVPGVLLQTDADDDASREVAHAHGLRAGNVHVESRLDLASFDADETLRRRTTGSSLAIRPMAEAATESEWRAFAVLFNRLMQDTPDQAEGADPIPYAVLRSLIVEPWQVMAAWEGDRMVGFTSVIVRSRGQRTLNTFLTGVERAHRGRGLSTLMKAHHGRALRDAGWETIVTRNLDSNAPIRASNDRLGFRYARSILDLLYDHAPDARDAG